LDIVEGGLPGFRRREAQEPAPPSNELAEGVVAEYLAAVSEETDLDVEQLRTPELQDVLETWFEGLEGAAEGWDKSTAEAAAADALRRLEESYRNAKDSLKDLESSVQMALRDFKRELGVG